MATEPIALSKVLAGLPASSFTDCVITDLVLDSRSATRGSVFVALQGGETHGLRFAKNAIECGASVVVHDGLFDGELFYSPTTQIIEVSGLREHLGLLADRFYSTTDCAPLCIAVTGTNGKTSCVQNIASLLTELGVAAGSIGTLGWGLAGQLSDTGLTTPDVFTVHKALSSMSAQGAKVIAIEASSHALVQGRLDSVPIHTGVFTNLSRDHLDFHGSFDKYSDAKALLFRREEIVNAVLNADDPQSQRMRKQLQTGVSSLEYSSSDTNADVYADSIVLNRSGISAKVHTPWGASEVRLAQIGLFNLQNLLAVIASVCLARESILARVEQRSGAKDLSVNQIVAAVSRLPAVPGRMQLVDSGAKQLPTVVVDYAHTPDGLLKALQAVNQHCEAQVWLVFGCGGDRDKGKRPQMAAIAEKCANHIIVTSDNPRTEPPSAIIKDVEAGFGETAKEAGATSIQSIEDRHLAIEVAVNQASSDDWVLVAGKGHENYQHLAEGKVPFDDVLVARSALKQRLSRVAGL